MAVLKVKIEGQGNFLDSGRSVYEYFDDFKITNITTGYIARGTVDAQSGSKLTTATKLTRSAAAQAPIIYQRECEVV